MKKKILILSVLVLSAMTMRAEKHQIGDYVEKDGVPSIVVYVDETGEHGLLLSMQLRVQLTEAAKDRHRKDDLDMFKKRYKYYHLKRVKGQGEAAIAHVDSMYQVQLQMMETYLDWGHPYGAQRALNIPEDE